MFMRYIVILVKPICYKVAVMATIRQTQTADE